MALDINYHHLYYFWVCVRAGSLTSAARELKLSQSALSLQLKSLENSVGRRLLDRSRSGVLPTAEGRLVFERCERIFPEGESLASFLRAEGRRTMVDFRIGVAGGLGREVIFEALDAIAPIPGLKPAVVVSPGGEILQALLQRRLDAAFFSGDVSSETGPSFRTRRLAAMPVRLVASPELARSIAPFPRRGREVPMILRPPMHPVRRKVDAWMAANELRPQRAIETADVDLMHSLALQGRGVAALRLNVVKDDVAAGRLVRLPGGPTDILQEVWVCVPARAPADAEVGRASALLLGLKLDLGRRASGGE